MSTYSNRPKDYELGGFRYDARVLSAPVRYLSLQNEAPLVLAGLGGETDRTIEADLAAYAEILASRADGIHRPVRLREIDRLVCTCALVARTEDRFREPVGHLDVRCRRARTVIIDLGGDTEIISACQECGVSATQLDLFLARTWSAEHKCPSRPLPTGEEAGRTGGAVVAATGRAADDVVPRVRTQQHDDAPTGGRLIPWDYDPRHHLAYPLVMLRCAEQLRQGRPLREGSARRFAEWSAQLRELNAVVTYDPASPKGFILVPREEGDEDLIRRPRT